MRYRAGAMLAVLGAGLTLGGSLLAQTTSITNPTLVTSTIKDVSLATNPAWLVWPAQDTSFKAEGRLQSLKAVDPAFVQEVQLGTFGPGKETLLPHGIKASVKVVQPAGAPAMAPNEVRTGSRVMVRVTGLADTIPIYGRGAPLVECILYSPQFIAATWTRTHAVYAGETVKFALVMPGKTEPNFATFHSVLPAHKAKGGDSIGVNFQVGNVKPYNQTYRPLGQCRLIWVVAK